MPSRPVRSLPLPANPLRAFSIRLGHSTFGDMNSIRVCAGERGFFPAHRNLRKEIQSFAALRRSTLTGRGRSRLWSTLFLQALVALKLDHAMSCSIIHADTKFIPALLNLLTRPLVRSGSLIGHTHPVLRTRSHSTTSRVAPHPFLVVLYSLSIKVHAIALPKAPTSRRH